MKTLLVLLLSICIISCNKETVQNEQNSENTGSEKLNFQYKGIDYSSTFKRLADNSIVLDDQVVNIIYQGISNLPELSTLVHHDGYMVFFDNLNDLQQACNFTGIDETDQTISTKALTSGMFTAFQDDFGFGDQFFYVLFTHDISGLRDLKEIGKHNDKMTGFRLTRTRNQEAPHQKYGVGLFENINYGGQSTWFYLDELKSKIEINLWDYPSLYRKVSSLQFGCFNLW